MAYRVKYGFSSEGEEEFLPKFLETKRDIHNKSSVVEIYVCFSSFIELRKETNIDVIKSPLYYQLLCNPEMLEDLVNEINALNTGVTLSIVDVEEHISGYPLYLSYERKGTSFSDFKYVTYGYKRDGSNLDGRNRSMEIRLLVKQSDIEDGGELLPLKRCTVSIKMDSPGVAAQILLEYLYLTTIRMIDFNEGYVHSMVWEKGKLLDSMVEVSNRMPDGHSIYETNNLSMKAFKKSLFLDNAVKAVDDRPIGLFSRLRQSGIIDLFGKER